MLSCCSRRRRATCVDLMSIKSAPAPGRVMVTDGGEMLMTDTQTMSI
jgi:hypothetical protein